MNAIDSPLCERCHALKHHEIGVSIFHPSLQSIQETVFESPYKYNHIYHVIDAADFPMSLIPGLYNLLHITPQRSLNRRSKTGRFYHGKKMEISFIITRSDLLAPLKVHVDHMMPYLREVLRESLGRTAADVRLGNIRCVSAKQGWWTKELKEDIWGRGGAGWMVGKVNVGKSQLFNEVFPKGRRGKLQYEKPLEMPAYPDETALVEVRTMEDNATSSDSPSNFPRQPHEVQPLHGSEPGSYAPISRNKVESLKAISIQSQSELELSGGGNLNRMKLSMAGADYDNLDSSSLLPPPQSETDYPAMPLVSSLPGTTASPIRIPFGNGKGELIDLPGLSRGDLELYVQPVHRPSLVMRSRIRPEQKVIKPGQSLLLGGFIRITPTTADVVFLAYSFNPLKPHLTSTEKAIGIQRRTRESNIENIALPDTADKIVSAGTFHLKWDVTKDRTGPMTARAAAGIRVDRLPFRVMSADILIEGVGWVELTAQIRKQSGEISRSTESDSDSQDTEREDIDPQWPTVEVYSPEGKYVAVRRPMNAWLNFAEKPSEKKAKSRPRRSMKGMKKLSRQRARVVV